MNGYNRNPCRLERQPGQQGLCSLLDEQDSVEKLATGKTKKKTTIERQHTNSKAGVITTTTKTSECPHRLKIVKATCTVGTWNVQNTVGNRKVGIPKKRNETFRIRRCQHF